MRYFTRSTIQQYASTHQQDSGVRQNLQKAVTASVRSRIFLSHSHQDIAALDAPALNALKVLFADMNVDVYIDALDPTMPEQTSARTAELLKERISLCTRFVLVATTNAKNSKWVPWELGIADQAKGLSNIAILPVADENGQWEGSEYMGLYQRIQIGDDNVFGIYNANRRCEIGTWLS